MSILSPYSPVGKSGRAFFNGKNHGKKTWTVWHCTRFYTVKTRINTPFSDSTAKGAGAFSRTPKNPGKRRVYVTSGVSYFSNGKIMVKAWSEK